VACGLTLGYLFDSFFLTYVYIQGIQMKVLGKTLYSAILISTIGAAFASDKKQIEDEADKCFRCLQQGIMQNFPGDNPSAGDNNISMAGVSAALGVLKLLKEEEEEETRSSSLQEFERKFYEIMKGPAEAKSKKAG